jgi:hypothetical protein
MTLVPGDPLAHRALDSLLRAEASVRRRLSADLEREGLSASGFSVLVVLTTAGGELPLRALRHRPAHVEGQRDGGRDHARAAQARPAPPLPEDRRAATVALTTAGAALVDRLFPEHTARVQRAFAVLDDDEKRLLAEVCRKLAA